MCDTKLRETSAYTAERLNVTLERALFNSKSPRPLIGVDTASRLLGHINPNWLSNRVIDALFELQDRAPDHSDEEKIIAPVFRTIEDFKGEGVIANIHPDGNSPTHWALIEEPILDEPTGKIEIEINGVKYEGFDPRNPTIWPLSVYKVIKNRKKPGTGKLDIIAGITNTGIMLGGFSQKPEIPKNLATATKRHFNIVGK